ncbi:hypothetical protein SAMN04489742_2077 [Arthrobacter crystallopoietes]|jgi:hypothetical protein|uniref:Uncharacterized protein n=2 Tax=Crystallibacter crystallopoietes TaxID=37928 RepID=A0A1H1CTD4_9MICC|nr:hypothetical protein AC20117_07010 [Arthrobacter crystallopoietes]SDQ67420.1 hypothetical protein SAMN04489742_2077 [Arthrobacter crystallopoietes]
MDSMSTTTAQKKITATTAEEAQRLLDIVVDELRRLAVAEGTHGILVTKTGPGQFSVELSENVPYGITEEAIADHTDV